MRKKLLIFCSVLFIVLAAQIALAAGEHSLSVFVYDQSSVLTRANITVYNSTNNWVCTNCESHMGMANFIVSELWDGNYNISVSKFGYATKNTSLYVSTDRTVDVFLSLDTQLPQYSNCNPASGTSLVYVPGASYDFNCTWTDDSQINNVIFRFASSVYQYLLGQISKSGNNFNITLSNLAAGTYSYNWSANDTNNNLATTPMWSFIISQAQSAVNLNFNATSPQPYGTYVMANCTDTNPEANSILWRNGTDVTLSENEAGILLDSGIWSYICNVSATQNYTSASTTGMFEITPLNTIDPTDPLIHLTLNDQENDLAIYYSEQSNATGWKDFIEGALELYINGSLVSNPHIDTLGAGVYNYTLVYPGSTNYLYGSVTRNLTVNQLVTNIDLFLNDTQDNLTVDYGTETNATVTGIATPHNQPFQLSFERNGMPVTNPDIGTLPAGTYTYNAYFNGDQNFTADSETYTLTVNAIDPTDPLNPLLHLALNDQENDVTITYNTQSNATGWKDFIEGTLELYRNNVLITNPDIDTLAAGVYNYTLYYPATENYTAGSIERNLTIDQAVPTITLYFGGSQWIVDQTVEAPYTPDINATIDVASLKSDVTLFMNGGSVANPDVIAKDVGVYTYNATFAGNENYTATNSASMTLNVIDTTNPVIENCSVNPASGAVYAPGASYTFSCDITDLYLDKVTFTFNETEYDLTGTGVGNTYTSVLIDLPANTSGYAYSWFANDTSNNQFTINDNYIINPATATISIYFEGSVWTVTPQIEEALYTPDINATIDVPSLQSGVTLYLNNNPTSNPEAAQKNVGTYEYNATYDGTNTNYTVSPTATMTINVVDTIAPSYSACSITPDPATYVPGQTYTFTCDFTDINLEAVSLTFDGIEYSAINTVGDTYEVQFTDLSGGSYNYNWFANDTSGNSISEPSGTYVISQAVQTLGLTIDGQDNDVSVTYPTSTTALATTDVGTVTLLRDSTPLLVNPEIDTFGVGTYVYTAEGLNNENYTSTPVSHNLTVGPANPGLIFTITPPTPTYGTPSTASCTDTNPEADAKLYRDNQEVPTENGAAVILSGGNHNYVCNITATQNYTSDSISQVYAVNPASVNVDLFINDQQSDVTIDFGNQSNATAIADQAISVILERNVSLVSNPDIDTLPAGAYVYYAHFDGNENFTADSETYTLTVSGVDPTDPTNPLMHLTLNDQENDVTITYGNQSNATGWKDFTEGTLELYRDGTLVTNPEIDILAAGIYNYTLVFPGSTNYLPGSVTRILTVNQTNPTDPANPLIHLTLNDQENSLSIFYNTESNATGWKDFTEGVLELYINGSLVSNPHIDTLAAGVYNYTLYYPATENYTEASIERTLTVDKASPTINLYFEGSLWTVTPQTRGSPYTPDINATIDVASLQSDVTLFMNGGSVANPDTSVKSTGTYEYNATFAGNENYTAASTTTMTLIVSDVTSPAIENCSVNPASPTTYSPGATYTFACDITDVNLDQVIFTFNSVDYPYLISGDTFTATLNDLAANPAGYAYSWFANDTEGNPTTVNDIYVINKTEYTVALTIDGQDNDVSVTYPTATTALATSTGTVFLTRNGTSVSNPDTGTLGVGAYVYTAQGLNDENYTSNTVSHTLVVNPGSTSITLYFEGAQWLTDESRNVPYTSNVNATINVPSLQSDVTLFMNGGSVANPESGSKSIGNYIYNATFAGNENYTASVSTTRTLTILDAGYPQFSACSITPDPATYAPGQTYTFQCDWTDDVGIDTVLLNFNGVQYTPSVLGSTYTVQFTDLSGGSYPYSWFANDTNGNTVNQPSGTYVISPVSTAITLYMNTTPWLSDRTETYPYPTQVDALIDVSILQSGINFERNGTPVSNPETILLDSGTHNYTSYFIGNENYTSSSVTRLLTIQPASGSYVRLYLNDQENSVIITYGDQSNATAIADYGTADLYRDSILVSSPEIEILGAGVYNYTAYSAGDINHLPNSVTYFLTVNRANPIDPLPNQSSIHLAINGLEADGTILGTAQSNATGWKDITEGTLNLYRDGVLVDSGNSPVEISTLPVGVYNYTIEYLETQNYTYGKVERFLNVLNNPPVADAGPDVNVSTNDNIRFDGSSSYDIDGTIVAYLWNFGDGETSSSEITDHSFTIPGTYNVSLTVTDNNGATSTDTAMVDVIRHSNSGGGSAQLKIGLDLISPDKITIKQGESKTITLSVKNNGQAVLKDIEISASGMNVKLSPNKIGSLKVNETKTVQATLTAGNETGERKVNFIAKTEGVADSSVTTVTVESSGISVPVTPPGTALGPSGYFAAITERPEIVGIIILALVALAIYYLYKKGKLKNLKMPALPKAKAVKKSVETPKEEKVESKAEPKEIADKKGEDSGFSFSTKY